VRGFLLLLYSFPFFSFSLRKRKQATSAAGQRLAHLLFSALFPLLPPPPSPSPFSRFTALSLPISVVIAALDAAKGAGAYKTILDCSERNVSFYERAGLARKEVQMVKYY
jgi:hypothetical protein